MERLPWSDYRVTPEQMRQGGVGIALSVLYRPGEELGESYTEPPESRYFAKLLEDLLAERSGESAAIGGNPPLPLRPTRR